MRRISLLSTCAALSAAIAFSQQPPSKNPIVENIVKEISAKNIR